MKPRYDSIDNKLSAINDQLFARIRELAIKAMEKEPDLLRNFCMAMGSISFHCVYDEPFDDDDDIMHRDEDNEPREILDMFDNLKCVKELEEIEFIIHEYNPMFKLTGQGIKIDWVENKLAIVYDW